METIKLNLIPTGSLPVVHTSQYDEGRVFRIELFEGSAVYTLDGTEVLECDIKKPDGNIVTIAVVNTSDNYVDVETTLQMNACAGESFGELHIKKGAQEIGTLNFILAVERSPLENGIQSDSGIHNLQTQIADAVADQYDSADVIFDATPTAGHGVGYAVTSEGIKDAIDNAIGGLTIPEEIDDLTDVTITTPADGDILVYSNGEWVNIANPASTANFGADYDDTATYNKGDKCIYNNLFYICNTDNTTGAWDATKWDAFTVADITAGNTPLGSDFSNPASIAAAIKNLIAVQDFSESATIAAGTAQDVDFSCAKAGYTLIGVVCFNCYYSDLIPSRANIRTTNLIRLNIRNVGSASRTASISITALYMKTL